MQIAGQLKQGGSEDLLMRANLSLFSKFVTKSTPYEQYIKKAATGIVNFLRSAQDMQASAQKLMQKDDSYFQARTAESSETGTAQTSQSFTIDLGKGKATASLLTPSMEAVEIQIKPDENKVIVQVKDLLSSYNAMKFKGEIA